MKHDRIRKIVLAAMFVALGIVLPFLTGQIPQIGKMLLPMHIPVFLCGLICGWQYGAVVGFVTPLLRFALFAMPPMPSALTMAFELATYGIAVGIIYAILKRKGILSVYISLLGAMLAGRAVWGVAQIIVTGVMNSEFSLNMFMAGAFLNALPGIVLQLVLIPGVMALLDKAGLLGTDKKKRENPANEG